MSLNRPAGKGEKSIALVNIWHADYPDIGRSVELQIGQKENVTLGLEGLSIELSTFVG